ncbi:MAG: DUF2784 family protein [Chloroflexi bacterium]|nr:DUF2784 family protein [Chloroflexota bacterium]
MSTDLLRFLDGAFFTFHGFVVLVNVFGWIPARMRRLHRAVMAATAFSWFVLGPLLGYGVGYCFCTDWHWRIRRALGYDDSGNYVQLLFGAFGLHFTQSVASLLAYGAFAFAVIVSTILQLCTWLEKK